MENLKSRDDLLRSKEARDHIAIALILYSDFRKSLGVDWTERAKELQFTARIFGVADEVAEWQPKIPQGRWDFEN